MGCLNRFLLNKTIDVLLYVDRLDAYRVDNLDRQVVKAITDSFGKEIWRRGVVVLTHAQLSPPDGLNYEDFFSKRSEALMKVVRSGARLRKQDIQVYYFSTFRRLFQQVLSSLSQSSAFGSLEVKVSSCFYVISSLFIILFYYFLLFSMGRWIVWWV